MPVVNQGRPVDDSPAKRAMAKARVKANRRRALPRWTEAAMRLSMTLSIVAVVGFFGVWLWHSGKIAATGEWARDVVLALTRQTGFRVREVYVEGREASSSKELVAALGVGVGDPILGFDLERAREQVEKLPWVKAATIERRLPDVLFLRISERKPLALWQHDQKLMVIDREGAVLTDRNLERFADLPIVVGEKARERAPALLDQLAAEPLIGPRVSAAIWIGDRRWDLDLAGGVRVRLPEGDVTAALRRLAEAVERGSLLDRSVVAIDLRLPDRLVVQGNPPPPPPATKKPGERKI